MTAITPPAHQVLDEVTAIGGHRGGLPERAEELLDVLHRLVRFDAGRIALFDAPRHRQTDLAIRGYPDRARQYLAGPGAIHDAELLGLHRDPPPMRIRDLPRPAAEFPIWAEYLHPAGFREGVLVPLVTPDGRYLGLFAAMSHDARPVSDATCALLGRLSRPMAHALDPMRAIEALAALVTDAIAGVVLTGSGGTVALPGLPGHRLLRPGSPILAEARTCYDDGDTRATFLTPTGPAAPSGYLNVTVLACPDQPPHELTAVVLLRPAGDLRHLCHREMTVLGMLISGCAIGDVGARLRIPAHSVRVALEQARAKLGTSSSAAAVMRAADHGLYLPPSLIRSA
ncbi:LuxR C-terminal-related transcriptional regulator [Actinoplanes sp. NPDC049548]|uniref:LuxR C-terminal-related transcriptional regulator n=1 Tax=Actinoplanes sp. NPDC049548 TaxID=3155152 RepID=UPI00341B13B7